MLRRWRWLSPLNIPWVANAYQQLNRRGALVPGQAKRSLSATDVKGNVEILIQLREYNRLVDRANDLERMNRDFRQHRQKSWLLLVALPMVTALTVAISTQNLASEAVLCPSEQSLCWWLRWDDMKRVRPE